MSNFLDFNFESAGQLFARGVFSEASQQFSSMVTNSGISEVVREFASNAFNEMGSIVRENFKLGGAGTAFNEEFSEFWKHVNLEKVLNDIASEFNKAAGSATGNLNFQDPASNLGNEFGAAFEKFGSPMSDAIGTVTGDIFRAVTFNSVPYLASGALILMGTPLGALYFYHRAKHNIGRPKLASEVHLTGFLDKTQAAVSKVARGGFDILASGAKWGAIAAGTSIAMTIPAAIGCEVFDGNYHNRTPFCHDLHRNGPFEMMVPLVVGAAVTASVCTLASKSFGFIKDKLTKVADSKPIFNDTLTEQITDITNSVYNLKKHGGYFQNVLLYGPGGTGKTMVAKMIAKNSNMNYVFMSGGDLAQYIKRGEHVTELNKLFEGLKNSHSPTILFIDEIESLAADREKMDRSELFELLNAFLSHTGVESNKFMVIGATNMPSQIDAAVLSRMDHKLYIGPPEHKERKKIIEQYVNNFFSRSEVAQFFGTQVIETMTKKAEGLTGRTIFKMVNALASKKMASKDNKLTPKMINDLVDHFVNQEKKIAEERISPRT